MTEYKRIEMIVGIFVFIGIVSMGWMALKLGQMGGISAKGYQIEALFEDIGGIRSGNDVMLAGVVIGRVNKVTLQNNEEARLSLLIHDGVHISSDAMAAIRTKGIIGERYVRINQGAEEDSLVAGDEIEETESVINIEDLISKYIFSTGG